MFGNHSGSGGLSPLWLLVSVAIGASLSTTQCASTQAQPIDFSLSQAASTNQPVAGAESGDPRILGETPGHVQAPWAEELESEAWPGFVTGMSGYDDFVRSVGVPMYFEDPFIRTHVRRME